MQTVRHKTGRRTNPQTGSQADIYCTVDVQTGRHERCHKERQTYRKAVEQARNKDRQAGIHTDRNAGR
jgi:hypothetical protein